MQPGFLIKERYKVIKLLAKTEFSYIFEVDDNGIIKILKVLRKKSSKFINLLQREFEVLSLLHHAGIPRVQPDGYLFWKDEANKELHGFVMDKIDGLNLEECLNQHPQQVITEDQAIDWLKQLLNILDYIHQQGYIHRDIKPSNILVKNNGKIVLIDFNTCRAISETYLAKIGGQIGITRIGTVGYMPPEQNYGFALPQSDFFALALTLVRLLTGKLPYELLERQTGELILRNSATQLSSHLIDLLEQMVALSPSHRPQSAKFILQRLESIQIYPETERLLVNQNSGLEIPEKSEQINLSKTAIPPNFWIIFIVENLWLSLLILMRLIGFRAISPKLEVTFNDRGVDNHMANRLAIAKIYYQCALLLKPGYKKVRYNLGSLYEKLGKYNKARSEYEIAIQGNLAVAYNNLARLEILDKKYASAVELLLEGLLLAQTDEVKYAFLKNLGWALLKQNRYTEAETYLGEAIKLMSDRAPAYGLLAQLLERLGQTQSARIAWENFLKYAPNDRSPEVNAWIMVAP